MAKAERKLSPAAWGWVLIAGLAAFELSAQPLIHAAVPRDESWDAASAFVRERFQPGDRIVASPYWADPIVRSHLGDLQSLRMAAASDSTGIGRIWELGIRGKSTRDEPPALEALFDGVRVRMWALAPAELLYDFVEDVDHARVELETDEGPRPCPRTRASPIRGGLGQGPMTPPERFVCDAKRPWLWVGPTVVTDLSLEGRRCIWQHPAGALPIRVIFSDVPLGTTLLIRAGVEYEHARWRVHGPIRLRVWIDDEMEGELQHEEGSGWSGIEIDTRELGEKRATVRFEVSADDPSARAFCWSARSLR